MLTQTELPFWVGDANAQEERSLYLRALLVVKADIYLCRFVERVFDSNGKEDGWVRRSYKEIAEHPHWLMCSIAKARQTVERAESLGLVKVERRQNRRGAQQENGYAIDWQGIKHLCGITPATTQPTPATAQPTAATTQHTPAGPEHGECSSPERLPLACACAPTVQTDTPAPPTATADGSKVRQTAHAICRAFWKTPPDSIRDRRDQRLIYRLAVLLLDEDWHAWIKKVVSETIDKKPKNPLAMLQSQMAKMMPNGWTVEGLLCSIDVPGWALCDPREWCPNGENRQQE